MGEEVMNPKNWDWELILLTSVAAGLWLAVAVLFIKELTK